MTIRSIVLTSVLATSLALPPLAPAARPPKPPTRSTTIALFRRDTRLALVNREADSLTVLQVRRHGTDAATKLAEVAVGHEPRCVAIGAGEREAFVVNAASGTVSVVALRGPRANTVVAEFPVGTEPRGCAMAPNGSRLFVANYTDGTVAVVDPAARRVTATVPVGGNPYAVAVTNDGDDANETVFVTQFFAELVPGGPGEGFDAGKEGVVQAFPSGALGPVTKITLAPLAASGFAADRTKLCPAGNPNLHDPVFCPDPNAAITDDAIVKAPQGAFPNQLASALLRGGRLWLPNVGAAPEPPVAFNTNVQALVNAVDATALVEDARLAVNLNAEVKNESEPSDPESLDKLFGNDLVALDADPAGRTFLVVSRGGNFVFQATRGGDGTLTLGSPVVRYRTGNLPDGVAVSADGRRAYTDNEVGMSVSVLDLETKTTRVLDLPAATPPEPGTFAHAALVGKLVFHTALGIPNDGVFETPIRDIVPLASRGKQSKDAWSSCASCHPDGLADGVTWIFGTGPRQTLPLDAFFSKRNPADQRISNYSAVQGSITDFNNNSIKVQNGKGFVDVPTRVFAHGFTQGASDALDAETLWVQTIRPLNRPKTGNLAAGAALFRDHCASCHGGDKWTKSQVVYLNDPTFAADPNAGGQPLDPGVTHAGAQIVSYAAGGRSLRFLKNAGTFDATSPLETKTDGTTALGTAGFNVPSLLGIGHTAPYFHDGSAPTLDDVFARHRTPEGVIGDVLGATERAALRDFLLSIDGTTPTFPSDTDAFLAGLVP
jgi:YVTN family beta-propeller protein